MQIDSARLWEHLRYLCQQIGPRLSGTPADARAVEYIAAHFRRCGARVEVQDYPCPAWDHESTCLELLGADGPQPLAAVAQTFTPGCDVEAELVVVGTRHQLEFQPELEGRILVLHGEAAEGLGLDRNPGLLAIEERRPAAALLLTTAASTDTVSTKLVRDPFVRVPVAAVPAPAAAILRQSQGRIARLCVRARRYDSTGHNVIGHLAGAAAGRIVIGAHYDTAAGCAGAVDDASGTAVLLELCQTLAAWAERGVSLDFIAFGAEEYGRHVRALGSVEYVRRHAAQLRETLAVVQLDGVGTVDADPRAYVMGWPADRQASLLHACARFPRCTVTAEEVLSSDHAPFYLNGVPAVAFMNSWQSVPIHTSADTLDLLDPDELALAAHMAAAVVGHLAGWNPSSAASGT